MESIHKVFIFFLAFIVHLGSLQAAPVLQAPTENMESKGINKDSATIILTSSCANAGTKEIKVESKRSECISVSLDESESAIQTIPEGLKLHLFEKELCKGTFTIFTPTSGVSTTDKSSQLPSKVSSIKIYTDKGNTTIPPTSDY